MTRFWRPARPRRRSAQRLQQEVLQRAPFGAQVLPQLRAQDAVGRALAMVLDGGPAITRVPSTIIDVRNGDVRLLREGALAWSRVLHSTR